MQISFECPNCDARLTGSDSIAGKKIRCKNCDKVFVARPAAERDRRTHSDDDDSPRSKRPKQDSEETSRGSRARKDAPKTSDRRGTKAESTETAGRKKKSSRATERQKKSPLLLVGAIAIGAVVLIGGGIGGYFAFFHGPKTNSSNSDNSRNITPAPPDGPTKQIDANVSQWTLITDKACRFQIRFPGNPKKSGQDSKISVTNDISSTTQYELWDSAAQMGFDCYCWTYGSDLSKEKQDKMLGEFEYDQKLNKNTISKATDITHQDYVGKEFHIKQEDALGTQTIIYRFIFVGNRKFMLELFSRSQLSPDSTVLRAFFNSLVIEP